MLDGTKVIPLGPVSINFNGADLGHTDETGATAKIKTTWVESRAGKYGKGATLDLFKNGQEIEIEGVLQQSDMVLLNKFLPGANIVTNSNGDSKLTFGETAGKKNPSGTLILTPFVPGNAPGFSLTIVKAGSKGDWEIIYSGDKITGYKFVFRGLIDEISGSEGSFLFTFGDSCITADPTIPSVTAFDPADGASGVLTTYHPVATFNRELDPLTVNNDSVHLIEDPLGTAVDIPGTVVLANNLAATTVTFIPTSPLTASTQYMWIFEGSIKGTNHVSLAFSEADFQTA